MTTNTLHPFIESLQKNKPDSSRRLSWDDYFISLAIVSSYRSPSPKLQVGAVIVKDNRTISTGYNGYFSGAEHKSIIVDGHEINTVHAEENAITDAAKRGVAINHTTIYVTHYPCIYCTKAIIASGIKSVKYLNDYNNNPVAVKLFNEAKIETIKL